MPLGVGIPPSGALKGKLNIAATGSLKGLGPNCLCKGGVALEESECKLPLDEGGLASAISPVCPFVPTVIIG